MLSPRQEKKLPESSLWKGLNDRQAIQTNTYLAPGILPSTPLT